MKSSNRINRDEVGKNKTRILIANYDEGCMAEGVTGNPVQWSVHATVNTHMECYNFTMGSRWILEQYCGMERLLFHFYQL